MKSNKWAIKNIPDLSGKVIIVTGGNSGLGFESVKAFADNGAEVVMASRNIEKGEEAKARIKKHNTSARIKVLHLDLMDLISVKNFADKFKETSKRLDVLVNNAGVMIPPYTLTKEGFESQMGTNHLGHFALTGHLINMLVKTPGARVVSVSSIAHKTGKMDFNNLLFEEGRGYEPMKAYRRSKLANLLFTYELQRFFEKKNIDAISVAAHPGISYTNLMRFIETKLFFRIFRPLASLLLQNPANGALPQIRAAVDPDVKGGDYFGPDGFIEVSGSPVRVKSNSASHNEKDAKKLWEISEKLTGVDFRIREFSGVNS